MSLKQTERSDLWMLLGFILGIVGGVIAYVVVKKDDRDLARKCLYIGMAATVMWIVAPVAVDVPVGITESKHVEGSVILHDEFDSFGIGFTIDDSWIDEEFASFVNEELDDPANSPVK
ncbi:MAG: hypothetical protein EB828_04970 [Nitrosopumilus sp. D6]|nr:MAG: hypothetical protein EB828_04970 [Nitrosopumilus sp. D6]